MLVLAVHHEEFPSEGHPAGVRSRLDRQYQGGLRRLLLALQHGLRHLETPKPRALWSVSMLALSPVGVMYATVRHLADSCRSGEVKITHGGQRLARAVLAYFFAHAGGALPYKNGLGAEGQM